MTALTKQQQAIVSKLKGVQFWVSNNEAYFITQDFTSYIIIPVEDMVDGTYDLNLFKLGKVKLLNKDGVERIPKFEAEKKGILSSEKLLKALPFKSDDESRYFMNGVLIYFNNNFVATDGRVMYSTVETDTQNREESIFFHIIKKNDSLFKTFVKISNLKLSVTGNIKTLEAEDGTRWVDYRENSEFPNWERVYPDTTNYSKSFTIPNIKILKEILKVHKGNKNNSFRTFFDLENGKITIEDNEDFEWEVEKGEDSFYVNINFLITAWEAGIRKFKFDNPERALVGYVEDSYDVTKPEYKPSMLMMPMQK